MLCCQASVCGLAGPQRPSRRKLLPQSLVGINSSRETEKSVGVYLSLKMNINETFDSRRWGDVMSHTWADDFSIIFQRSNLILRIKPWKCNRIIYHNPFTPNTLYFRRFVSRGSTYSSPYQGWPPPCDRLLEVTHGHLFLLRVGAVIHTPTSVQGVCHCWLHIYSPIETHAIWTPPPAPHIFLRHKSFSGLSYCILSFAPLC